MKEYATLREASAARRAAWDTGARMTLAHSGNEMAGEIGEALDAAVEVLMMASAGGRACNLIKKLERERLDMRGSRASLDDLRDELADVVICADLVAQRAGIDLDEAVARKFNATSEKVGLPHRLMVPGERP